jgi:hypothetical protein
MQNRDLAEEIYYALAENGFLDEDARLYERENIILTIEDELDCKL